jgi:hypothetical protein
MQGKPEISGSLPAFFPANVLIFLDTASPKKLTRPLDFFSKNNYSLQVIITLKGKSRSGHGSD